MSERTQSSVIKITKKYFAIKTSDSVFLIKVDYAFRLYSPYPGLQKHVKGG
jgi:hypothetical protein